MRAIRARDRRIEFILDAICGAAQLILGQARRLRRHVRKTWSGEDPMAKSRHEAVYVCFDRHGIVHDYVVTQLASLVQSGYRITFVSNSPRFSEQSLRKISGLCRQILWRYNTGYDFGGYKDGIAAVGPLDNLQRLILMNDSVYGPLYPLKGILDTIDSASTDVWGITDSWQHHYHIQSYFMVFLNNALRSPSFQKFWQALPYINSKRWVIRTGEIKLSQVLAREGLRMKSFINYWDVARAVLSQLNDLQAKDKPKFHEKFLGQLQDVLMRGVAMNPTDVFWETLLTDFRSPFLKREVVTANPSQMPLTWRWDEVILRVSSYDRQLIWQHLRTL